MVISNCWYSYCTFLVSFSDNIAGIIFELVKINLLSLTKVTRLFLKDLIMFWKSRLFHYSDASPYLYFFWRLNFDSSLTNGWHEISFSRAFLFLLSKYSTRLNFREKLCMSITKGLYFKRRSIFLVIFWL